MKIEEIHEKGKWPILVGGTHYYLQSLLFQNTTMSIDKDISPEHSILSSPTSEMFSFLQSVDPEEAARLHPYDRRKIQRRVELYLQTGRPASQIFKQQKESTTRWDTLIFWIWSDRTTLNERLDNRVDNMITEDIETECRELYQVAQETNASTIQGVFQAIGTLPLILD